MDEVRFALSPRLREVILTVLLASGVASGCHQESQQRGEQWTGGPALRPTESVVLQEHDSLFLARPLAMYPNPSGGFYVSDLFRNRVVLYDAHGVAIRTFGRAGAGPGELRQVSTVFVRDDSTLAVFDISTGAFSLFDRLTATFSRAVRFDGIGLSVAQLRGTTWLGAMNLGRGTAVGRWRPGADSIEYLIPLPDAYLQSRLLAGNYAGSWVAVWEDTVAVGMTASDTVRFFTTEGQAISTVSVPARRRRGIPADLVEQMQPTRGLSTSRRFSLASALLGLYRRHDGALILVHADQELDGRLITAKVFVSLLSADRTQACVDAPLSVSQDSQPVYAFSRDTLFVLEQRIVDGEQIRTTITGYRVEEDGCNWIDLQ